MITFDPPSSADGLTAPHKSALTRFLIRAQTATGLSGQIDVLLTEDATLRRLNRAFRGKNKPTDILSFPAAPQGLSHQNSIAGDLAISLETAARQAAEQGHSLSDELKILLLHGVLHLAGYDHEIDAGEMAARESELRRQLRLPNTLIARTDTPVSPRRSKRTGKAAR